MKFDLTCETDAGSFALYDPAAVAHLGNAPDFRDEARKGNLTLYSYGGNGDMRFRLFVDEPVDAALVQRADGRVVGVLPVGKAVRGREAAQTNYPGAVVHLRRLPDGEDIAGRSGCVFGPE